MNSRRNVLIVGGASGIGRITSELLLEQHYQLFVADNNEQKLNEYREQWDGRCKTFLMDISKQDSVRRCLSWIRNNEGALDVVVITAGVHCTYPVEYIPDEVIDRVVDVNLVSHVKFVRDVIPIIRDGGRIIAVSSLSATVGIPMQSMYSASKAGLELFYESLSLELAYKQIKCSIVQPGNVNTGFNETGNDYEPIGNEYIDRVYNKVLERIGSRHGMSPKTVAHSILRAIAARNPKLCYVVGANAVKAHWAKRLLGRDLSMKVLGKVFGL